jgi:hypothetical protein
MPPATQAIAADRVRFALELVDRGDDRRAARRFGLHASLWPSYQDHSAPVSDGGSTETVASPPSPRFTSSRRAAGGSRLT